MKELVTITGPQSSDVGQLLFYMLGIFIKNVSIQNNQQQLGLYIEGDKVSHCAADSILCSFTSVLHMDGSIEQLEQMKRLSIFLCQNFIIFLMEEFSNQCVWLYFQSST